jgi:hypothetical protein
MAASGAAPGFCPDWVLATGSNVHVTRDRAWFSTYTPFPTFATHYMSNRLQAHGIGDVHLPVKLFPKRSGPGAHGTLHLRNVLYVPTAVCNIVGNSDTGDYSNMVLNIGEDGQDAKITTQDGRRLGYFVLRSLWVLKLSGPPIGPVVGPSIFKPGTHYIINATWPDSERQRWAAAQADGLDLDHRTSQEESAGGKGNHKAEAAPAPPYTEEEKGWLKRQWGGEFKFLAAYGLRIYEDEDREEGRRIARAMMEVDEDGDTYT